MDKLTWVHILDMRMIQECNIILKYKYTRKRIKK